VSAASGSHKACLDLSKVTLKRCSLTLRCKSLLYLGCLMYHLPIYLNMTVTKAKVCTVINHNQLSSQYRNRQNQQKAMYETALQTKYLQRNTL